MRYKLFFLALSVLAALAYQMVFAEEITAEIYYSGRTNPAWVMNDSEVASLIAKMNDFIPSENLEISDLGKGVISNQNCSQRVKFCTLYAGNGGVILELSDGKRNYYLDRGGFYFWLLDLGNLHDPNYIPPKYTSLPPNTSHIEIISENLTGVSLQNKKIVKRITIFSEGTGELIGTIKVPDFVNTNETSFRLAPIESGKDFFFEINTRKIGNFSGEIIIESNDPENRTINLPVNFQIYDSIPEPNKTSKTEAFGEGSYSIFVFLLISLLFACIGAFLYRRIKKSNS